MAKLNAGLRSQLLSRRQLSGLGYVGMGATDARFGAYIITNTLENDNLSILSSFYGASPQDICAANGVPWDSSAINQWVIAKGGKCLPHQSGQPAVAGCPDGGWAVFRNGNKILLPNKSRPGVSPVTATPGTFVPSSPVVSSLSGVNWFVWGTVGLIAVAVGSTFFQSKKA